MVYDVPRLIEYATSFYTLYPGDLIFSGTPEGVGVKPGDEIRAGSSASGSSPSASPRLRGMNLAQHVLGNRYPGRIALVCGDEQNPRGAPRVRARRGRCAPGVKRGACAFRHARHAGFRRRLLGAVHAGAVAWR